MRRLWRAPLLHFLLLGGTLLATRGWWDVRTPEPPARIVLGPADVTRLREEFAEEHGAPPTGEQEAALLRAAVDEEVLYRTALATGIDRSDGAVRERLARLGGFLGEEGPRDRDAQEREARRLGLERSDVVVRRHLVEMMRLATTRPAPSDLPDDAALQDYLDRHAADFTVGARVSLTHVYLAAATHGDRLARDAAAMLADLRRTGAGPDAAATRGDPFIRGANVGPVAPAEIGRIFGDDVARAVEGLPVGAWSEPIASPYGLHLVWVRARVPARVASLASVRNQVLLRVLDERGARRGEERMRALRARYDVAVERP